MLSKLIGVVWSKMLSILASILPTNNNITLNREQRRSLINELWKRGDPQVMIARYNDEDQRIGTQGTITTFHTNPIEAIYAFFDLLGDRDYQRHPALNDNMFLWLFAHADGLAEPTAKDLVDNVMSDLTDYNTVIHHSGIIALEIIPLLEYHNRDHGTLAEGLHGSTDLSLVPMSEFPLGPDNYPPTPNLGPDNCSPNPIPEPLIDHDGDVIMLDGVVSMFDHSTIPSGLNSPILGHESEAQPYETEFLSQSGPESPLFAAPTPGPVPLPTVRNPTLNALARNSRTRNIRSPRRRIVGPDVDARKIHACTFAGCSSRFTRSSDLARHWRSVHTVNPQQ